MGDGLLPSDPDLPQLQVAWNSKLMLEVFQRHLKPYGNGKVEILDCKVSRFRYRQGIRSIILYLLVFLDKRVGVEKNVWLTGMTCSDDRANRLFRKLRVSSCWKGFPDSLLPFEPVSYIPDLKMLVQVFPQDRYLKTLPLLIAGPPPKLRKFVLDEFGVGSWHIEHFYVEVLRYRPNEGVTLLYEIKAIEASSQKCEKKNFYIKIYRDEEDEKTYELLKRLYVNYSSGESGVTLVRPLAYFKDYCALIFEAARGRSLEDIILRDNDVNGQVLKSAVALAAFHQSKVDTTIPWPVAGTLHRVRKAVKLVQWALPNISKKVGGLSRKIEQELEDVPLCPTHQDMKLEHLFIDVDTVSFIDLDIFALGDPVFDPACLFVRMEMLTNLSSISRKKVHEISQVFLGEYFSRVPNSWRKRFPVNYACAALTTALYHIQHQEANWQDQVGLIVNKASAVFSRNPVDF